MKNIIIAWIKKYLLRIESPSGIWTGHKYEYDYLKAKKKDQAKDKEYKAKVITRGNCMICGKELTEGLFICKECGNKANKESEDDNE